VWLGFIERWEFDPKNRHDLVAIRDCLEFFTAVLTSDAKKLRMQLLAIR